MGWGLAALSGRSRRRLRGIAPEKGLIFQDRGLPLSPAVVPSSSLLPL